VISPTLSYRASSALLDENGCAFPTENVVTLTARHRISRRGITELADDLFGVNLSNGAVDGICRRASAARAACRIEAMPMQSHRVARDPPPARRTQQLRLAS
jgi:hypothetical protein